MTARTSRRRTLLQLSAGATTLLIGCGSSGDEGSAGGATDGSTSGSGPGSSGSTGGGSNSDSDSGTTGSSDPSTSGTSGQQGSSTSGEPQTTGSTGQPEDCEPAAQWAAGGTTSMSMQECYPDPFENGVGQCMLMCQMTEGPCTSDAPVRQDVSEGLAGLPVRLALKFVDVQSCEPIEGALVEIWHTQRSGVYSGVTPGGDFCYGDDPSAEDALYFRGTQTTDADGRVDFDTCYPGWYPGRAIHIHFRVVIDGQQYLVSQLFFEDALNEEVCTSHPEYARWGAPNTTNESDGILGDEADKSPYLLQTERMADGAMLAWKVVAIRSSTNDPICST